MQEAITIRPVRDHEHAALVVLTLKAYTALEGPLSPEYVAELVDVAGRVKLAQVLVAVDERQHLLGGVTLVPGPDSAMAEFEGESRAGVRMLAVDPDAQGRGVGRALVAACIERARAAGRKELVLHTTTRMQRAVRLYESMGFTRRPEMDWIPRPDVHPLGYGLPL